MQKAYNLSSVPYLNKDKIPKSDTLQCDDQLLKYNFHGSGCTFTLGTIELEYDIYIDRDNYIVTSPYEFMTFVNSVLDSETKSTESQITVMLESLNNKGIISKIYENYLVYEISFEWYRANVSK